MARRNLLNRRSRWHTLRKSDRPRNRRDFSPKLSIDEIRNPSEKDPGRRNRHQQISQLQDRHPLRSGNPENCERNSDKSTMTRHSSLPNTKKNERIGAKSSKIIKQKIPDPSTGQDTDNDRKKGGTQLIVVKRRSFPPMIIREQPKGCGEGCQIGQPIITDSDSFGKLDEKRAQIVNPVI